MGVYARATSKNARAHASAAHLAHVGINRGPPLNNQKKRRRAHRQYANSFRASPDKSSKLSAKLETVEPKSQKEQTNKPVHDEATQPPKSEDGSRTRKSQSPKSQAMQPKRNGAKATRIATAELTWDRRTWATRPTTKPCTNTTKME